MRRLVVLSVGVLFDRPGDGTLRGSVSDAHATTGRMSVNKCGVCDKIGDIRSSKSMSKRRQRRTFHQHSVGD